MNAPLPPDAVAVARAPLSAFAPSATNRKHNEQSLQQLDASIAAVGVIQPITARPWPASRGKAPAGVVYEIVVGEGRWLSSDRTKQPDIPFFWRELTDEQALVLQLTENLHRTDITALEEAADYRRLMKDHGHTVEQLMKQFGKTKAYLYARLKLLDLCPGGVKYFNDGKLDASTALLIARIPDVKLQEAAAKSIATGYGDGPMSYRNAFNLIQREYMLELDRAPFSRSAIDLLASVGSCKDCQKRTGNAKDLFSDVKSADICTDPSCYQAKTEAHVANQKKLAKTEGRKIIDGAEAKKIKPHSYSDDLNGGYVDLDKTIYKNGKSTTIRQALKDEAPKADLLIDPTRNGTIVEVVQTATIKDQLKAKGYDVMGVTSTRGTKSDKQREEERKLKQEATYRRRLYDQIRSKLTLTLTDETCDGGPLRDEEYRLVTSRMFGLLGFDTSKRLAQFWIGPTDEKQEGHELVRELSKQIPNMKRADCARLLLEMSLVGETFVSGYNHGKPDHMLDMAASLDIDAAAIKTAVISEMREKAKPKAAKKVQPKTAQLKTHLLALQIGERVRVIDGAKGPTGHFRKCCGRVGVVTAVSKSNVCSVEFDLDGKKSVVSNLGSGELERVIEPTEPADTTSQLEIGDRVRVNATAKSPLGSANIGKAGHVTSLCGDSAFMIAFTPKGSTLSYHRTELDKLPADSTAASTPTKAAQAQGVSAKPAAPAKTKGKAAAAKDPKAKAGTAAPAAPNDPAAPGENQLGKTAWPFPPAAKKTKAKTKTAAPAAPNKPAAPAKTSSELRPAEAWPFPTGNRPAKVEQSDGQALEAAGQKRLVP
jgi:ParB/RepB/Spo0J family partition protein